MGLSISSFISEVEQHAHGRTRRRVAARVLAQRHAPGHVQGLVQLAPHHRVDGVAQPRHAVVVVVLVEVVAVLRQHVHRQQQAQGLALRGGQVQLLRPHVPVLALVVAVGALGARVVHPELQPSHGVAHQHALVEGEHAVVVEPRPAQPPVLHHERAMAPEGRHVVARTEGDQGEGEVLALALARAPGGRFLGVRQGSGEQQAEQAQQVGSEARHVPSRATRGRPTYHARRPTQPRECLGGFAGVRLTS